MEVSLVKCYRFLGKLSLYEINILGHFWTGVLKRIEDGSLEGNGQLIYPQIWVFVQHVLPFSYAHFQKTDNLGMTSPYRH